MKDTPLVSLILISYKHKKYISDCMQSVLDQSYSNMEILYLDDASMDGTFEKASDYKERLLRKYERVEFIANSQNSGLVKNLNKLVKISQGKYVKFLAADDFMLSCGIEKLVDYMESHPEDDMVFSNGIVGDENTHYPLINEDSYSSIYSSIPLSGNKLFDALYQEDFISAPSVMIRKNVYERVGLYDESIGIEDWDFFLRLAKEGSIGYLDAPTVMYRMLIDSLSHSAMPQRRINMKKSELQILEKNKDFARNAKIRLKRSLNEALDDAFHIDDKDYLSYLYLFAKRNTVQISLGNKMKCILYQLGIIRLLDKSISINGSENEGV